MSHSALILVDIQNDYFPDGLWPLVGIEAAAANAARLLADARSHGSKVIHVRHEFAGPQAPFFAPGSEGARIHACVAPLPEETVLLKHHANAFRDTGLAALLARDGIRDLAVAGAMSHMCIEATVRAAADRDFRVSVIHDACATRDLEFGGVPVPAAQVRVKPDLVMLSLSSCGQSGPDSHFAGYAPLFGAWGGLG